MNRCMVIIVVLVKMSFVSMDIVASPISSTVATVREILRQIDHLRAKTDFNRVDRPFVIASFAQSLDGKISPWYIESNNISARNYPISGVESLLLTHAIRSQVDAVLIGGRTLSIDNPRLTNRLWNDNFNISKQPRPVVLDTNLIHLKKISNVLRLKNPIVCCSSDAPSVRPQHFDVVRCKADSEGLLCVQDVLLQLCRKYGIKSLMVEGGAAVLTSFFEASAVDAICLTVAPKLLSGGICPFYNRHPIDLSTMLPQYYLLGKDFIVVSQYPTH